jgi:hypothetical protein
MDEIDIWRAIQPMINLYGDRAPLAAARRADKAIDQGDPEGERVWIQVIKAVNVLLEKPMPGKTRH